MPEVKRFKTGNKIIYIANPVRIDPASVQKQIIVSQAKCVLQQYRIATERRGVADDN
jgi:hypothetical protein